MFRIDRLIALLDYMGVTHVTATDPSCITQATPSVAKSTRLYQQPKFSLKSFGSQTMVGGLPGKTDG